MSDFVVAYTLSDKGNMVNDILVSLKSLSRFVDRRNIVVFYTPPMTRDTMGQLFEYAKVITCDNISKPFVFQERRGPSGYGEKLHICDLESENVFFLDCDTVIKKDLGKLLEGDYDFAARAVSMLDFNLKTWYYLFQKYEKDPVSMYNTGFLIFKNWTHNKIKEDWTYYMNEDLPQAHPTSYHKDQYSLALALSGLNIKQLTKREHAFRWRNEENIDSYVLHGSKTPLKYVRLMLRNSPLRRLRG